LVVGGGDGSVFFGCFRCVFVRSFVVPFFVFSLLLSLRLCCGFDLVCWPCGDNAGCEAFFAYAVWVCEIICFADVPAFGFDVVFDAAVPQI